VERDQGDLEAAMTALPDGELLRIVGVDRDEYRSEALKIARAELTSRGVALPEPADAQRTADQPAKSQPLGRISGLTKSLLVAAGAYTLAAKWVPDWTDRPIRLSPSLGLGLVSAMLWSMAWDVRVKSAATSSRLAAERTWHKGLVFWASLVTLAAVYFGSRELDK
jgi:hypothetical protein